MKKKIRIVLMCVLLVALAACHTDTGDDAGKSETAAGETLAAEESEPVKGRFIEEELELDDLIREIFYLGKTADGRIQLLFEGIPGTFYYYESADSGVTWEKEDLGHSLLPENHRVVSAAMTAAGEIIASVARMSEHEILQGDPEGEFSYYRISGKGDNISVTQLQLDLPEPGDLSFPEPELAGAQSGHGLKDIKISDTGLLYGFLSEGMEETTKNTFYCLEPETGAVVWTMESDSYGYLVSEGYLYFDDGQIAEQGLRCFDQETGEEMDTIPASGKIGEVSGWHYDIASDKIYYGNAAGVYVTDWQSEVTEELIDGSICSLSDNAYQLELVFPYDEAVVLTAMRVTDTWSYQLFRYEYDPDVLARPEHELIIYSLKDNYTVENMISLYQKENPDIYITYKVGMMDEDAVNVSEAIKMLNTEIMAGTGPDVIFLNGLPAESYKEQGALLNLSEMVSEYVANGEVYENIMQVYGDADEQYIVPVNIRIPAMTAKPETLRAVSGLQDIVKLCKDYDRDAEYAPMMRTDIELVRYMTSIYAHTWYAAEGTDEKALSALLQDIKELNDELNLYGEGMQPFYFMYEDDEVFMRSYDAYYYDDFMDGLQIENGMELIQTGYLNSIGQIAYIYNSGSDFKLYEDIPAVFGALTAGVSAKSDRAQEAVDFVSFMLRVDTQELFFDELGLPVNRIAYQNITEAPSVEQQLERFGAQFPDFAWPTEYLERLEKMIEKLDTPVMEDGVVTEMLADAGLSYVLGNKELDAAVREITQALNLYLME